MEQKPEDRVSAEELDRVMSLLLETEFDYFGVIDAREDTFAFLKKSPDITYPGEGKTTGYEVRCAYLRGNFVAPEEREAFDEKTALETILARLEASGAYRTGYRCMEKGETRVKQLDYRWLCQQEKRILVVRRDITASCAREQRQEEALRAARRETAQAHAAMDRLLTQRECGLGRSPDSHWAVSENEPGKQGGCLEK